MAQATRSPGLSNQEKRQFEEEGFLAVRGLLPKLAIQPLIDDLSGQVEYGVQAAVKAGFLASGDRFEDDPFETRLALVSEACSEPGWIWKQFFLNQKIRTQGMFALRTSTALLDVIESLIGPEIYAHPQFNYRAKMPDQDITVIPWHQDLAYLNPDEAGDTLVANAWIPLVDATLENGCMQVIRGSHLIDLIAHDYRDETPGHTGSRGIEEEDLPDGEVFTAELEVGDVLLTCERLVHRGTPNTSKSVRWSVDTRYCQMGLPTGREDVPGFVARSKANPGSVTPDHHAWNALFDEADA